MSLRLTKGISNIFKRSTLGFMSAVLAVSSLAPLVSAQTANALPLTTYQLTPSASVVHTEAGSGVGSLYTFVEFKSLFGGWNDFHVSLGSAAITATATGGAEVSTDSTNWDSSKTVNSSFLDKVDGSFYLKSDTVGTFPINLSATINTTEGERVLNETVNLVTSDTTAPGQATNPSPTDGSVLNMGTLRDMGFSWTAPSDASPVTFEYGVTKAEHKDEVWTDGGYVWTVPNYNGSGRVGSSTPVPGNDLEDGDYYWKVRYTDASGNVGPWSDAWKFTIDSTAPTVTWQLQPLTVYGTDQGFHVRPITSEVGTTKSVYIDSVTPENLVWTLTSDHKNFDTKNTNNQTLWDGLSDGTHKFIAVFTDYAGNTTTSSSDSFMVDRTAPTASLTVTGGKLIDGVRYVRPGDNVKFTVSNPDDGIGSGVDNVKWIVFRLNKESNGKFSQKNECNGWTNANFVGNTLTKTFNVEDLCSNVNDVQDGSVYALAVRVYDNIGNYYRIDNQELHVDGKKPVLTNLVAPSLVSKTLQISVDADDPIVNDVASGVAGVKFWLADQNSSGECKNNLPALSSAYTVNGTLVDGHYTATLDTSSLDGSYCILAQGADGVLNHNTPLFKSVSIDNTAPVATNVTLSNIITDNGVNYTSSLLNGGKLDVTFTTDEPLKLVGSEIGFRIPGFAGPPATGWTKVELVDAVTNKYMAHIDLTNRTDTSSASYVPSFFANKTYSDISLYFRLVDALSNKDSNYYLADGGFGKSSTNAYKFTLDNEESVVKITNPSTNGAVVNNNTSVTIEAIDAADLSTVVVHLTGPNGEHPANNTCLWKTNNVSGTSWSTTCDLAGLPNGAYTLKVGSKDLVGHTAATAVRTFAIDNDAPVLKVEINRNYTDNRTGTYLNDGATASSAQKPEIEATDDHISKIKVTKEDGTFVTEWTNVVPGKNYKGLSWLGEGTYKIYAYDAAGNEAGPFTLTIDNTNPAQPDGLKLFAVNDNHTYALSSIPVLIKRQAVYPQWNPVTLDVNGNSEVVDHYNYESLGGYHTTISGTDASVDSTIKNWLPPTDRTDAFRVQAVDAAGNVSEWSDWMYMVYDSTAPVVTLGSSLDGQTLQGPVNIKASIQDDNVFHYYVTVTKDGTDITTSVVSPRQVNNQTTFSDQELFTLDGDGLYTVKLEARDEASALGGNNGNKDANSTKVISFTIDNTGPNITGDETGVVTGAGTIQPSLTDEDGDPSQTGNTYVWVGDSANPDIDSNVVSDPSALNPLFTVTVEGDYKFTLTATDRSGNVTTKTFSFTYTKPVVDNNDDGNQDNGGSNSGDSDGDNNGFSNVAVDDGDVQGATDDAGSVSDDDGGSTAKESKVAGAATHKTDGCFKFLGVCWYYWIPMIIVVIAVEEFTRRKLKASRANV